MDEATERPIPKRILRYIEIRTFLEHEWPEIFTRATPAALAVGVDLALTPYLRTHFPPWRMGEFYRIWVRRPEYYAAIVSGKPRMAFADGKWFAAEIQPGARPKWQSFSAAA